MKMNNKRKENKTYKPIIDSLLNQDDGRKTLSMIQKLQEYLEEKKELLTDIRKKKGIKHPRNKLNELNGNEWAFFTKTILRTSYPFELGHKLRKIHYANKPPQLMKLLIEFCTRLGETILDPFAGVGGTLLGASLCSRKATGIEINPKWIEIYEDVCKLEDIKQQELVKGDCLVVMNKMITEERLFDAIITDPPYSPALEKTLCDGKYGWASRKSEFNSFSSDLNDFRNANSFNEYYDRMEKAGYLMYKLLRKNGYLMVMIRDSYQSGEYIPSSFYVGERLKSVGFTLKGVKYWYQTGAPVRPYGYPYSYVPNIVHHAILILRKESVYQSSQSGQKYLLDK